jgi:opacity protein-like surface antigen
MAAYAPTVVAAINRDKEHSSMKRILALAVLASLAAAPAMAADNDRGFYWGFDLGQFQYSLDKRALDNVVIDGIEGSGLAILSGASDTSEDGFTWGLMGGYQFFKYLAVEAAYVDLGTAEYRANVSATDGLADYAVSERLEYDSRGFAVSALGILPLRDWSLYGRLGYYLANNDATVTTIVDDTGASFKDGDNSQDFFWGIGGGYTQGQWTLRLEFQQYMDVGDTPQFESDIDRITIGAIYKF